MLHLIDNSTQNQASPVRGGPFQFCSCSSYSSSISSSSSCSRCAEQCSELAICLTCNIGTSPMHLDNVKSQSGYCATNWTLHNTKSMQCTCSMGSIGCVGGADRTFKHQMDVCSSSKLKQSYSQVSPFKGTRGVQDGVWTYLHFFYYKRIYIDITIVKVQFSSSLRIWIPLAYSQKDTHLNQSTTYNSDHR